MAHPMSKKAFENPEDERKITPYDPLITLKKAGWAALISGAAVAGAALLSWLAVDTNLQYVLNMIGLKGVFAVLAIPVLQAIIAAALNYLKTRRGVYYDRREDVRKDGDRPVPPPQERAVMRAKRYGPPEL